MIRYYYIAMYAASHKNIMSDAMSVLTHFNVPSCRIAKGSDDPVYLCSYHRVIATRMPLNTYNNHEPVMCVIGNMAPSTDNK